MKFNKYQHIEKLGREEVDGLLDGKVFCFPKIDGTNGCLFLDDDGNLCAGSRKRQLTLEQDNAGFYADSLEHPEYKAYLEAHPNHILYGEWLVKHTIKHYDDDAWRKFYVFDVLEVNTGTDKESRYVPYYEYQPELAAYNIGYIPLMVVLNKPSIEDIADLAKDNHYLISDGENIGEGIVCKRYDYKNKWGRVIWGKLVAEEFFNKKQKLRTKNHEIKSDFEAVIAQQYITDAVIKKEYAKIQEEYPEARRNELIGRVLNTVYESFITEDLTTVVRKNKNCVINFRYMKKQSDWRVKEVLADELFN